MPEEHWNLTSAPGPIDSDLDLLITAVAVGVVIISGFVLRKLSQPRVRVAGLWSGREGWAGIPPGRARELVSVLGTQVIPAVTAGSLIYAHMGSPREALLVFLTILAGCWAVARFPYPLHLMPAARLLLAVAGPGTAAVFLILLDPATGISRADVAWAAIAAVAVTIVGRWNEARFEAERPVAAAVIGSPAFAWSLAEQLKAAGIRSHRVVGWLGLGSSAAPPEAGDPPLGMLSDVRSVVVEHRIDLLVCAPPENGGSAGGVEPYDPGLVCRAVTDTCLDLPVRMIDGNQLYEELLGHVPIATIDAAWFRYIMHPRFRAGSPLFKRLLDLGMAFVGGILALPILALSALAIKLEDGGPLLYRQRRIGERGRELELLKLRTMNQDSESDGRARWSSADDTRVTVVGRFLRRTHFDELPQLWNVLRGEMAIVGPRPERPELVSGLERRFAHYERRHLVKPGITGWAQVRCGYGGSEAGTALKLSHDLYYLKHRSLATDLLLLAETVVTVAGETRRPARVPGELVRGRASGEEAVGEVRVLGLAGGLAGSLGTLSDRVRGALAGILGRVETGDATGAAACGATGSAGAIATGGTLANLGLGGAAKVIVGLGAVAVSAGALSTPSVSQHGSAVADAKDRTTRITASDRHQATLLAVRGGGGEPDPAAPSGVAPPVSPEEPTTATSSMPDPPPTATEPAQPEPAVQPAPSAQPPEDLQPREAEDPPPSEAEVPTLAQAENPPPPDAENPPLPDAENPPPPEVEDPPLQVTAAIDVGAVHVAYPASW
jgi:exopolysaccharide biosynthesis polyprenyl glycosylphosphotransferase